VPAQHLEKRRNGKALVPHLDAMANAVPCAGGNFGACRSERIGGAG
jgi:hypothetical protein